MRKGLRGENRQSQRSSYVGLERRVNRPMNRQSQRFVYFPRNTARTVMRHPAEPL